MAKAKLGSGARFKALSKKVGSKALAAYKRKAGQKKRPAWQRKFRAK